MTKFFVYFIQNISFIVMLGNRWYSNPYLCLNIFIHVTVMSLSTYWKNWISPSLYVPLFNMFESKSDCSSSRFLVFIFSAFKKSAIVKT